MTWDKRQSSHDWRMHWWGKSSQVSNSAISTDVVFSGPELSALGRDTLKSLLSFSVGIANLQQKTLFADWLTMELSDDFLTDLTALEADRASQLSNSE